MLEKKVEEYLREQAERRGCLALKFVSPNFAGVPDRIVLGYGKVVFVEMKRPKQSKTIRRQKLMHNILREKGMQVEVLFTKEQVDEFLDKNFPQK